MTIPTRTQLRADAAIGLAVVVLGCGMLWGIARSSAWYPASTTLNAYLFAVASLGIGIAAHRAIPGLNAFLAFGIYPVLLPGGEPNLVHMLPVALAGYSATRFGALRWPVALAGTLAGTSLLFTFFPGSFMLDLSEIAQLMAVGCFAVALGQSIRRLDETRAQLEARNADLVALQGAEADRAVTAERNRISRDLHDIVAHHVTAIVVRAQAALHVSKSKPEQAPIALEWIVGEGKESLVAMRSMVSMLRVDHDATGDLVPALNRVADRMRSGGLAVDVIAPTARLSVSPDQRQAILRIAQESLTNVALHSSAPTVELALDVSPAGVSLEVTDPGPRRGDATERVGNGLRHMRERAQAAGATLTAGPHGDGWQVSALFPVRMAP